MFNALDKLQLHPVFLLLVAVSCIVLNWSLYFHKSTRQTASHQLNRIKVPYLCYSFSILGWILTNAYFFSPLLVKLGEPAAITVALAANLLSYSAFACAYMVCLMLASSRTIKIELTLLSVASIVVAIANLANIGMIEAIEIEKVGHFTIRFGENTPYFFATVWLGFLLSFRCVIQYARNAKPLQQIKSLYMVFGISVFMVSTLAIHVVIPIFYDDFSMAWLPPALSISEMMLMGYALVTSRFYSSRYICYRILSLSLAVLLLCLPLVFIIEATNIRELPAVILLTLVFAGTTWKWLLKLSEQIASEIIFNDPISPQRKIYNLVEDFQTSIDKPLRQVADILGVQHDSIQLISNVQDETLYTTHLQKLNSVLVLEEIEDSIPHSKSQTEGLSLRKIYRKMDSDNVAMVLPIFDSNNVVIQLLIARKRNNGRLFFGEEIQALQSVLKKAQGYINADLKIKQSQALANSIAHEMRNPLAQAQLEFESIEQQATISHYNKELISHAQKGKHAISRGKQLIDIILREVNHSSLALEPTEPTDLTTAIRSTIELYGFENEAYRHRIELNLEHNFVAKINETLFNFVIFNLLRNATYYFDSYPSSYIEISTQQGEFENCIVFKDTGPGIPEKLLGRIFDDFFSYKKSGGSGLGLGYCQRVMSSFGGSISCHSVLGQFTEFKLCFPTTNLTAKQNVPTEPTHVQPSPIEAPKALAQKAKPLNFNASFMILVVDDKEVQRTLVKLYLEQLGYGVVLANNGKVAIEIIQSNPIDLVFMDIQMPVMDGFEAASIIRQSYPAIPIIALSGESGEKELERMGELMDGRLSKPTTKEALSKILNSTLSEPSHH